MWALGIYPGRLLHLALGIESSRRADPSCYCSPHIITSIFRFLSLESSDCASWYEQLGTGFHAGGNEAQLETQDSLRNEEETAVARGEDYHIQDWKTK